MIKKLRKKTVFTTMLVLLMLVAFANIAIHVAVVRVCGEMTDHILMTLAENEEDLRTSQQIQLSDDFGIGTLTISKDELFSVMTTPLYSAQLSSDGNVLSFEDYKKQTSLEIDSKISSVLSTISLQDPGRGKIDSYRYYKTEKDYGSFVLLANSALGFEQNIARHLLRVGMVVSLPVLLVLFFVSVLLSHFTISPAVEALKKQKQFISDAGHELKTPLSSITVNAAVLASEIGPNKYMDCIQSEAKRMNVLVRQMLDVACVEDPEPPNHREQYSLSETVYQSTLPFESIAFERGIRYEVNIQEDLQATGDPERIRQVTSILLDNAFKYSDENGLVSLRLWRDGRRSFLEVYNTGVGISPEDLPHIFERFYRCDKARPSNGSYGLGLAIAKAAVEAHGGSITAESEYGSWARFRITL